MKTILDAIERIAPRLPYYPRWAQRLFLATLAFVLASVFVYAFAAPEASERAFLSELGFDVSVDPTVDAEEFPALLGPVHYVESDGPAGLTVVPESDYLATIARGGPIEGVPEYEAVQAPQYLPKLDLKLANNSGRTLFFTEAVLDVEQSVLDPRPVLVITNKSTRRLDLHNEGWGDAGNLVAHFDIVDRGRPPRFTGSYPHTIRIARVHTDARLDLTDAVRAEGVDLTRVARIEPFTCKPTRADLQALRQAVRPFTGQYVTVFGELDYSSSTPSGRVVRERLKFVSKMILVQPACAVSPAAMISAVYNVRLEVSGRGYTRTVPIQQYLKPGDVDRFEIVVDVAKSSLHRFHVRLRTNDGHELRSKPISLDIFVPFTHVGPMRRKARATPLPSHSG